MSTPAQSPIAANIANAQASTGPTTDDGKSVSSLNALKTGLFAEGDFIRPGEEAAYKELGETLYDELSPVGILERNLTEEIQSAMWRLRRCRLVEAAFVTRLANGSDPIPDPIQNEATAKFQLSVDPARNQSNRLLHKATAELRRLQTERQYRNEVLPAGTEVASLGICDFATAVRGAEKAFATQQEIRSIEADALLSAAVTIPQSAKRTQSETARNAPCPCNSGQKYKRCCGRNAPPTGAAGRVNVAA